MAAAELMGAVYWQLLRKLERGKALQFTNILRDVRNDAERGRIYLPEEELRRSGVEAESILRLAPTEGFGEVAQRFAGRARAFYEEARMRLPAAERRSMAAAELMGAVYWQLLRKLERGGFRVFDQRLVRVGKPAKCALILRTWLRLQLGSRVPNYGRV